MANEKTDQDVLNLRLIDAVRTRNTKNTDVSKIKELIAERADPNFIAADDNSALTIAAQRSDAHVIKALLKGTNAVQQYMVSPVASPSSQSVEQIKPTPPPIQNGNINRRLIKAIKTHNPGDGNVREIETLLQLGADPNTIDEEGGAALMIASRHGDAHSAQALLTAKADPNIFYKDLSPLRLSVLYNHPEVLLLLVEAGAGVVFSPLRNQVKADDEVVRTPIAGQDAAALARLEAKISDVDIQQAIWVLDTLKPFQDAIIQGNLQETIAKHAREKVLNDKKETKIRRLLQTKRLEKATRLEVSFLERDKVTLTGAESVLSPEESELTAAEAVLSAEELALAAKNYISFLERLLKQAPDIFTKIDELSKAGNARAEELMAAIAQFRKLLPQLPTAENLLAGAAAAKTPAQEFPPTPKRADVEHSNAAAAAKAEEPLPMQEAEQDDGPGFAECMQLDREQADAQAGYVRALSARSAAGPEKTNRFSHTARTIRAGSIPSLSSQEDSFTSLDASSVSSGRGTGGDKMPNKFSNRLVPGMRATSSDRDIRQKEKSSCKIA